VIVEALLVAICLLDGSFTGFRDAAGRNKLIRKWGYFRRAVVIGTGFGVLATLLIAATVTLGVTTAADPDASYARYLEAGAVMLRIYLPFTLLVLVALAFYAVPMPQVRSLATVTILGPFTCLRPFAIAGGALWAALVVPEPPIVASLVACVVVVAPLGKWLSLLGVNRLSLERMIALEEHTAKP
jgi:hypothetical protein